MKTNQLPKETAVEIQELSDTQIVCKIRRILESPTGHMGWKQIKARQAHLDALQTEANNRGLSVFGR